MVAILLPAKASELRSVLMSLTFRLFLQLDDTKQFRQLHSKTPGHPENFITDGVEVTTGARPFSARTRL